VNRGDWSEEIARELAESDDFPLDDQITTFIREARVMCENDGVVTPIRIFAKETGVSTKEVNGVFKKGPMKLICRWGGLRSRPAACEPRSFGHRRELTAAIEAAAHRPLPHSLHFSSDRSCLWLPWVVGAWPVVTLRGPAQLVSNRLRSSDLPTQQITEREQPRTNQQPKDHCPLPQRRSDRVATPLQRRIQKI
jgi:tRNA 2-thiouridine synthesizing protein E